MENVLFAFGLTTIAGLSTGIGSAIAFFAKGTNTKFLSVSLGFSAGVMIYVSMVEIFADANVILNEILGERGGTAMTACSFFAGVLLAGLIDKLIPSEENPHEIHGPIDDNKEEDFRKHHKDKLMRTGLVTALAIGAHNFPEGIATFISAMQEPEIAIPIVVAIAIHNIPEGMSVSVPIYYATGSRKKAFLLSFASGLAEPVGALVGYLILMPIMSDLVFGCIFAGVAGIMVFISLDELLPTAQAYGEHHLSIIGVFAGMGVMAISLILFL